MASERSLKSLPRCGRGQTAPWANPSTAGGASVAFQLTIYTAPGTQRVWTSSFDETQRRLLDNVWNAPRYPGGGTRWLSASELATWGANSSIESLP